MDHFHLELQHEFKTTAGFQNGIYSFKKKDKSHFPVCVFSTRSQMTSKFRKNKIAAR